jgi:hypothetical protein
MLSSLKSILQNSEDLEGVPLKPQRVGAEKPVIRRNQSDGVSAPKTNRPPMGRAVNASTSETDGYFHHCRHQWCFMA